MLFCKHKCIYRQPPLNEGSHNEISLQRRFPFTIICLFNEHQTRFNKVLSRSFFPSLKAPPYHASRQAFEYTNSSRGQHAHHSQPLFKTITASEAARLPLLNLPPKCPAMSPSIAKKTRKSLTLK
ncbi:hypothetical protein E2C01_077044 [Portunus trituberculatus]|uniref:Uncharacterized protein n=1 Tax=Portunus trituberculatus TaxID=210409 RepID=A0A5B7IDB0_PORTR|nr:hypothetical protein [Portunus trituberculatus]